MWKTNDERDAGEQDAEPRDQDGAVGVDEWGMLMAVSSSRLDLASDMLPAGLSDKPSMKSFGW